MNLFATCFKSSINVPLLRSYILTFLLLHVKIKILGEIFGIDI